MSDLAKHFHLPINIAAKELGICPTVLKKICRRNGMRRWPHRKVQPTSLFSGYLIVAFLTYFMNNRIFTRHLGKAFVIVYWSTYVQQSTFLVGLHSQFCVAVLWQIKSIERIIATLEQTIAEGPGLGDEGIRNEIAMLRNERSQLCAGLVGQSSHLYDLHM